MFVFEGPEAEWIVSELVDEPSSPLAAAFDAWRPLLDGPPRIARQAYAWHQQASEADREADGA